VAKTGDFHIETTRDVATNDTVAKVRISETSLAHRGPEIYMLVMEKIAQAIADEYVKAHLQDVLVAIDQQAVANLAVADSAAAIRQTVDKGVKHLHADLESLTREVSREREMLTPGFFGLKRSVIR
jgi:hypothetical protein